MIITVNLSLVEYSAFLINALLNFSFAGEYGNLTKNVFLSSNNHSGVIISSFPFSKLQIASFINFNGSLAFETIFNFERGKEEMIIPEWLFDKRKSFLGSDTLLRTRNLVKHLWKKSNISLMTK